MIENYLDRFWQNKKKNIHSTILLETGQLFAMIALAFGALAHQRPSHQIAILMMIDFVPLSLAPLLRLLILVDNRMKHQNNKTLVIIVRWLLDSSKRVICYRHIDSER